MRFLARMISRIASHSLANAAASGLTNAGATHLRTACMAPDAISAFLCSQRVMRVAFDASDERYLIPLGYVWLENAFYSMTKRGRKTCMAALNPKVSFQVDDSSDARIFTYISVTGEGTFEIVTDPNEIERVLPVLASRFPDTPDWAQAESATLWAKGELVLARIRPHHMSGVCNAAPDEC